MTPFIIGSGAPTLQWITQKLMESRWDPGIWKLLKIRELEIQGIQTLRRPFRDTQKAPNFFPSLHPTQSLNVVVDSKLINLNKKEGSRGSE